MALELNVGDVVTVRLNFASTAGQTKAFNTLHYRVASAVPISPGAPTWPGTDMEVAGPVIATNAYVLLADTWKDGASTRVTMEGCTVQNIYPDGKSRQYTLVSDAPRIGDNIGDMLPLQDCPTLVKRTPFGERWGIGRLFYVGLPEEGQDNGIITPDFVAKINAFGEAIATPLDFPLDGYTVTLVPCLYAPIPDEAPRIISIVNCTLSDNVLKTQRRRRPGKGI